MASTDPAESQAVFLRLKPICVPLLQASSLTPKSIPTVLRLLSDLVGQLKSAQAAGTTLPPSLINYTFFPLSNIMQRNPPSSIPDQVLEKVLDVITLLCVDWWWHCDVRVWEQIFILCGGVIGGSEPKGKSKQRDDPTKEAAVRCLLSLLRPRREDEGAPASKRLATFRGNCHKPELVPVLGRTLDFLLGCTGSPQHSLRIVSLDTLLVLLEHYFPDDLLPTVFPGVVSNMCKLSIGTAITSRSWANSEVAIRALQILGVTIVQTIGDDVCTRHNIIHVARDLEDFATMQEQQNSYSEGRPSIPLAVPRTKSWLQATGSQLHMALNTITPLTKHPSASVLVSLVQTSRLVLSATPISLPQSQPLLLSFILTLTLSSFARVQDEAKAALISLFSENSPCSANLSTTLLHLARDSLAALPRLLLSQSDNKVQHAAQIVQAVCGLTRFEKIRTSTVAHEVAKLLGPNGGIEKWGWSLLSAIEFAEPSVMPTPAVRLSIEGGLGDFGMAPFPEASMRNVSDRNAYDALLGMFRALGSAAGESSLHSIEWFSNIGQSVSDHRAAAALWCSCRLLEGVADHDIFSMSEANIVLPRSILKATRALLKTICNLWEEGVPVDSQAAPSTDPEPDTLLGIVRTSGIEHLQDNLKIMQSMPTGAKKPTLRHSVRKAMALQMISVIALIQQSEFSPLLIFAIYPLLCSLVSPDPFLAGTASAALDCVTFNASYASPSNLLMSNFDYALDAVGRRLSRRWLDVTATKVLLVLIRITGSDIVERAGDIVEECFDRLDDYHGYDILVEGLVEVLGAVVGVIKSDTAPLEPKDEKPGDALPQQKFTEFLRKYNDIGSSIAPEDTEDFGPTPQEPWGTHANADDQEDKQVPSQLNDDMAPTSLQALTKQIVSRSIYFLTHGSPAIRAKILNLLSSAVPVLPDSALMPSIHSSWPFILRRLDDAEGFVVSSAASLIEALVSFKGGFMFNRIWEDVWPRFYSMLQKLEDADRSSALARRGPSAVGTKSAYTHSHRVYKSLLRSMKAAIEGVDPKDDIIWQILVSSRRFLSLHAHEELQGCARDLYIAIGQVNMDAVWLALSSTTGHVAVTTKFMSEPQWDILGNSEIILNHIQCGDM